MSSAQKVWETAANGVSGMDRRSFVELMNGLWAGMGRTTMPDQITLRVWYLCLHDLTVQQFGRAIQRYLTERSSEFVNVQLIRELSGIAVSAEAAAILAWDSVIEAIRVFGSYRVPQFADHVTSHVINHLGGWVEICGTEPGELRKWTRQHFVKSYKSLAAIVTEPHKLKCLIHDAPRPTVAQIQNRADQTRKAIEMQTAPVKVVELTKADRGVLEMAQRREAVNR